MPRPRKAAPVAAAPIVRIAPLTATDRSKRAAWLDFVAANPNWPALVEVSHLNAFAIWLVEAGYKAASQYFDAAVRECLDSSRFAPVSDGLLDRRLKEAAAAVKRAAEEATKAAPAVTSAATWPRHQGAKAVIARCVQVGARPVAIRSVDWADPVKSVRSRDPKLSGRVIAQAYRTKNDKVKKVKDRLLWLFCACQGKTACDSACPIHSAWLPSGTITHADVRKAAASAHSFGDTQPTSYAFRRAAAITLAWQLHLRYGHVGSVKKQIEWGGAWLDRACQQFGWVSGSQTLWDYASDFLKWPGLQVCEPVMAPAVEYILSGVFPA